MPVIQTPLKGPGRRAGLEASPEDLQRQVPRTSSGRPFHNAGATMEKAWACWWQMGYPKWWDGQPMPPDDCSWYPGTYGRRWSLSWSTGHSSNLSFHSPTWPTGHSSNLSFHNPRSQLHFSNPKMEKNVSFSCRFVWGHPWSQPGLDTYQCYLVPYKQKLRVGWKGESPFCFLYFWEPPVYQTSLLDLHIKWLLV